MTNFHLFDKFMNSIDEPKGLIWEDTWSSSVGYESYVDFTKALVTDLDMLEPYSSKKHKKESFTGFVKANKGRGRFNWHSGDYDYLFIRDGEIRYLQVKDKEEASNKNKLIFYQDNLAIIKNYGGEDSKLKKISLNAGFELNKLKFEYIREKDNEAEIFIYKGNVLSFYFDLYGRHLENLTEEAFESYPNFKDYFKGINGNFLRVGKEYDEEMSLEEAMRILINS